MGYFNTMKKQKGARLALAMTALSLLPMGAFAQEGLFQRGVTDEAYYGFGGTKENNSFFNRNVETIGIINNQTFGQEVPVGSGLFILLAAGAGYAILKRKEDEQ